MTRSRVPEMSPEEEAELARIMAENDPDDIFPTDEELANAQPFSEAHPELAASILHERPDLAEPMRQHARRSIARRGQPSVQPEEAVSIRLDAGVARRSSGPPGRGGSGGSTTSCARRSAEAL